MVTSDTTVASVDFESAGGWSFGVVGDTATSGAWTRGDPIGTTAQPEDDHSPPPGTQCAFTGQGTIGGAAGAADVDGGVTTLQSPSLGTMTAGMELRFWYWYTNNLGANPNEDDMPVQVLGGGGVWTTIATISSSQTAWREMRLPLGGIVPVGAPVAVRFLARDLGNGSLVEAAIDDVMLVRPGCPFAPADLNNSGAVDGADLAVLLSQWGTSGSADLDFDGLVGGSDLALLLAAWG
jgi:aminopeptidase S